MAKGRPPKYKDEFAEQAAKLCLLGATDAEIAEFFDVDPRTLYRWKHDHEDFCQALKAGKDVADSRVERSLYQRAIGYSYPSQKIFHFQGKITRADCVEHVSPDVTACIFWLKNRKGEQWRDKAEGAGAEELVDALTRVIEAQAA